MSAESVVGAVSACVMSAESAVSRIASNNGGVFEV